MKNENLTVGKFTAYINARNVLKRVLQLSWSINQFDKKFPVETLTDEQLALILHAYDGFLQEILNISKEITIMRKPQA